MAAGDDSFIREVNEDIRQENLGRLWRLLRPFVFIGAAAIILFTIAAEIYSSYRRSEAQRLGDSYSEALKLADAAPSAAAFAALEKISQSGFGGYPLLARFRMAALLAQKGENQAAAQAYDALAADISAPLPWREQAMLRAGYLLADSGNLAEVEKRVKALATDVSPMRLGAREALGLAAWKAGRLQEAAGYFNRNYSDKDAADAGFAERAAMMLALMRGESETGALENSSPRAPRPAAPAEK